MNMRILAIGLVSTVLTPTVAYGEANENFGVESAGVRYGFGANNLSQDFQKIEATTDLNLPVKWDLGRTWVLKPRLEFSLGAFGNNRQRAVIGSVGPVISVAPAKSPVTLDGGFSVTGLSRRNYATRDLGSYLQFTSEIGLSWKIKDQIRVGYHFQHMSNGGVARDNQGVNMNVFSLAYCF